MGNQEDEEFYRNLSRKELQGLCKKHGLAARTTTSQMVHSLVSYYRSIQKSANSAPLGERCNGSENVFPPTSSVMELEAVREICKGTHERGLQTSDADSFGPSHCFEERDISEHLNSPTLNYSGICSHKNAQMCPKASGATVNMVLGNPSVNGAKEGYGCSAYGQQEITIKSHFGSQCNLAGSNATTIESQRLAAARNLGKNLQDFATNGGIGNSSQYRNPTSIVFSTEEGLPSNEASIKTPPFEFFVSSEDGIDLYVDLNSNPSEWVEDFTNNLGISQQITNLGVGEENMKISSLWSKDSGFNTEGDPGCPRSSPSSAATNDHPVQVPHYADINGESPRSCATIPYTTPIEISGVSENEDPVLSSMSRPSSDVQMQMVSGTETCLGGGEMTSLDLEVLDTSLVKSASNSALDMKVDLPNCPDSMKCQNAMLIGTSTENSARHVSGTCNVFPDRGLPISSNICAVSIPSNTASFENPSEICLRFSTTMSMEMQLPEIRSQCKNVINSFCQHCNSALVNFDNRMHSMQIENGESANCEDDLNTCRNPPILYSEISERSSTMNDRESSECSQIDNSSERTCKRSDGHGNDYCDGPQSKRLHIEIVDQNGCSKPTGKSVKGSMAREVPSPRRSLRLVSK